MNTEFLRRAGLGGKEIPHNKDENVLERGEGRWFWQQGFRRHVTYVSPAKFNEMPGRTRREKAQGSGWFARRPCKSGGEGVQQPLEMKCPLPVLAGHSLDNEDQTQVIVIQSCEGDVYIELSRGLLIGASGGVITEVTPSWEMKCTAGHVLALSVGPTTGGFVPDLDEAMKFAQSLLTWRKGDRGQP